MINIVVVVDKLYYNILKNELVFYILVIININVLINKFFVIFWYDKNLFCINEFWLVGVWFYRNVLVIGRREILVLDFEVYFGV